MHTRIKNDLSKAWGIQQAARFCFSCGVKKPLFTFNGKDNTCKLCRKLITMGLRYSYKIKLSPASILNATAYGEALCISCQFVYPLRNFADNSYECLRCWQTRCEIELAHYNKGISRNIACRVCRKPKQMKDFAIGRLTCRNCLSQESKGGQNG